MAEQLSKEEVKAIIEAPDFDRDGLVKIMKEDYEVDLDPTLEGDALVDFVYNTWQSKAAEVQATNAASKPKKKKKREPKAPLTDLEGNPIEVPEISRTDFIVQVVKNAGNLGISQKDIIAQVDEAYSYTKRGKSCRTRVTKVLRGMIDKGTGTKAESGNYVYVAAPE